MTKVSLIFVAWNRCFSSYLTLRNLFENQKLDKYDYEFIFIDDSSIDNTMEILSYFKDKYSKQHDIKIFQRKDDGEIQYTNNGVVKNYGIRKSSGDIIITIDIETYFLMFNGIENLVDYCLNTPNTLITPSWKIMEAKSHMLFRLTVDVVLRRNVPIFKTTDMFDYFLTEAKILFDKYDEFFTHKKWMTIRGEDVGFGLKEDLEILIKDVELPSQHVLFETFRSNLIGLAHAAPRTLWDKINYWEENDKIKYEWGGAESELWQKLQKNNFQVKEITDNWVYHINHPRIPDVFKCYNGLKCEIGEY